MNVFVAIGMDQDAVLCAVCTPPAFSTRGGGYAILLRAFWVGDRPGRGRLVLSRGTAAYAFRARSVPSSRRGVFQERFPMSGRRGYHPPSSLCTGLLVWRRPGRGGCG